MNRRPRKPAGGGPSLHDMTLALLAGYGNLVGVLVAAAAPFLPAPVVLSFLAGLDQMNKAELPERTAKLLSARLEMAAAALDQTLPQDEPGVAALIGAMALALRQAGERDAAIVKLEGDRAALLQLASGQTIALAAVAAWMAERPDVDRATITTLAVPLAGAVPLLRHMGVDDLADSIGRTCERITARLIADDGQAAVAKPAVPGAENENDGG